MSTDERSERRRTLRARPTLGQVSWITILVLIGLVQVIRAQPFDAIYFALTAGVASLDAAGVLGADSRPRHVSARALVVIGATAAAAISLLPRHGLTMVLLMLLLGAAALMLAWPGSVHRAPWTRGIRTLAWCWGIILVIGCMWELFAFILSRVAPEAPAPALSNLLDPMLSDRLGQILLAVVWVALGAWLVQRGTRR